MWNMFAYVNDESDALPTALRRPWHLNDIDMGTVVAVVEESIIEWGNFCVIGLITKSYLITTSIIPNLHNCLYFNMTSSGL